MSNPLISVIIPIYNCEKYLSDCIESVIKQTYKNTEIILVNDGSLDNSQRLCEQYADADSRIKLICKSNGGPSTARNAGLNCLTGEYVAFVDSDDILDYRYLEVLYELIKNNNADISSCGYDTRLQSGKIVQCQQFSQEVFGPKIGDINGSHYPYTVWHLLFKSGVIGNTRFDEKVYYLEDLKFVDEIFMKCNYMVGNSMVLYHRNAHEGSLTEKRYRVDNFRRYFTLINALEDMCEITRDCKMLYTQRNISLIKECAIMRVFMHDKKINDAEYQEKLNRIMRDYQKKIPEFNISWREFIILLVCVHSPKLYCKLKHVKFEEYNNSIV
jgi:glycosyltransferase involved in cell wall biosynthesis